MSTWNSHRVHEHAVRARSRKLIGPGALTMASLMAVSAPIHAQSSDPSSVTPTELEEVMVTGSRIRGVAPVGSPTIALDRSSLTSTTASTVSDFLKEVPMVLSVGIDETSFTSTGISASNASRASAINLRGLSPVATLVLVNGHRVTQSGTAGAFVDASAIPTVALERVDVVADGASALYGSDAIAGVVNLILRSNFTGAETTARVNSADGYKRTQFSQILGHNWGSGRAMFAYEYSKNDALNSTERSFYTQDQRARGGSDFRLSTCKPGNLLIGSVSYALPNTPAGGTVDPNLLVPNTRNLCDNSYTDIIPEQDRHSAVFFVSQDLTDRISISAEGYYSMKKLEPRFAAQGSATTFATLTVPSTNAYYITPPGTSPTSVAVEYSFFEDVGARSAKGESENYSGTVEMQIDLASDWQMQIAGSWGQNWDYTFSRVINNAALNAALASSDPQTALNPFGPGTPPAVFDQIFTGQFSPAGRNTMGGGELRLDGSLFDLPGGAVKLAAGGEYRRYSLATLTARGTIAVPIMTNKHSDREIYSGYTELFVPVVGASNSRPGVHSLGLSLAARYDEYSDFGDTFNPKIGVTWEPSPGLALRASYGTSFRAPTLSDISPPGEANNVTQEIDPQSPTGRSRGITIRAGNPNLKPEEATTFTFGVDWQPEALPGLNLNLTYFSVDYDNQIAGIFGGALQQEALYADVIIRNPTADQVQAVLNNGFPLSGVLPPVVEYIIDSRPQNRGATKAAGLDFQAAYAWSTSVGDFRLSTVGTWYTKYDTQQTRTAPVLDRVSTIDHPVELRGRASLSWSRGGFDASASVNYVDSYDNINFTPAMKIDSLTTVDLHAAYSFESDSWLDGLRLSLDASNVFDEDPPFVNSTVGFDPGQASPYGRMVSLTLTKRW